MPRLLPLLLLALCLGGCATSSMHVSGSDHLAGVQRYFVVANGNDNRALDRHIANALRARGLVADSGPRTMMPDDTQLVVSYEDHWSWDFGDRLQVLQITVREPRQSNPLATARFSARIPGRQSPADIVDELVTRLFSGARG